MPLITRISFYLFLPLLFGGGSYLVMHLLNLQVGDSTILNLAILTISLIFALLPAAAYRLFIHSQLQQGFARLEDGTLYLPGELPLGVLLGDRIESWIPFNRTLKTTICLLGQSEKLFVGISLDIRLSEDKWGKRIASQLEETLPQLQHTIQHALYIASRMDREMACSLDGSTLLNEEDESVLKSKFLSALETILIRGVTFPLNASGIHIDRNVRKEALKTPMATLSPGFKEPCEFPNEDDLSLNDELLRELGIESIEQGQLADVACRN